VIVNHARAQVHILAHLELGAEPRAVALRGCLEEVERREIEPVGTGEGPEVTAHQRRIENALCVEREVAYGHAAAGWQGGIARVERNAPAKRSRRASADRVRAARLARVGELGLVAIGRQDLLLVDIIDTQRDRNARAAGAIAQAQFGRFTVAFGQVLSILGGGAQTVLLGLGDNVDHAGDSIGAVKRGLARLQDIDPLDHALRDRVEVDGRGDAARRRSGDIPQSVNQHERTLGQQIAQGDFGRAGANAAAILRIADVARIVDLGVEAARSARQALEYVGDRGQAGLLERALIDADYRRRIVERIAADARTGDDDVVGWFLRGSIPAASFGGLGMGESRRTNGERRRTGSQQKRTAHDTLSLY